MLVLITKSCFIVIPWHHDATHPKLFLCCMRQNTFLGDIDGVWPCDLHDLWLQRPVAMTMTVHIVKTSLLILASICSHLSTLGICLHHCYLLFTGRRTQVIMAKPRVLHFILHSEDAAMTGLNSQHSFNTRYPDGVGTSTCIYPMSLFKLSFAHSHLFLIRLHCFIPSVLLVFPLTLK